MLAPEVDLLSINYMIIRGESHAKRIEELKADVRVMLDKAVCKGSSLAGRSTSFLDLWRRIRILPFLYVLVFNNNLLIKLIFRLCPCRNEFQISMISVSLNISSKFSKFLENEIFKMWTDFYFSSYHLGIYVKESIKLK